MARTSSAVVALADLSEAPEDMRSSTTSRIDCGLSWQHVSEIDVFDLTPRGRAAAGQGVCVSLVDDLHWSLDGHQFAAQAIRGSFAPESNRTTSPEHQ